MAKQISLMSHAPPIEESYLTHICLCNVCVSVPPKTGKKWQKKAKKGKQWQKVAIVPKSVKRWQKVAKSGKIW